LRAFLQVSGKLGVDRGRVEVVLLAAFAQAGTTPITGPDHVHNAAIRALRSPATPASSTPVPASFKARFRQFCGLAALRLRRLWGIMET